MVSVAKKFNYPCVIDNVIDDFILACKKIFADDKLGILLVGSAARGELCWSMKESSPCFYSDIEFIVVVEKMDGRCKAFSKKIAELERKRDLGKRFKIDYVLNNWTGITRLDKKIFVFDSKNTGIELGEHSVKLLMPDVRKDNLNFHELNDVLLHRMKALLMDVPDDVFERKHGHDVFCLSIAKNTLDITTWLYPYEADSLVSGFNNRLIKWEERRKDLILSSYFGDDEFDFLNNCIAMRRGEINGLDVASLLSGYVSIYAKAIAYCKEMNGIDTLESLSEPSVSRALFLEFSPRRRLKEASLLLMSFSVFGPMRLFANIFKARKGRQVEFCYSMIEALSLLMVGNKKKHDEMIGQSKSVLDSLLPVPVTNKKDRVAQWLGLRDQYRLLTEIVI